MVFNEHMQSVLSTFRRNVCKKDIFLQSIESSWSSFWSCVENILEGFLHPWATFSAYLRKPIFQLSSTASSRPDYKVNTLVLKISKLDAAMTQHENQSQAATFLLQVECF